MIPTHLKNRTAPLEMPAESFREAGHELVDRIADLIDTMRERPVTHAESPDEVRAALGDRSLPAQGAAPRDLLHEATDLLFQHSLFNGHPRFYGYVTSSPAPVGILADLLAAAVNANAGGWNLAPMATEIELQVVRWLAEFLGYPAGCGGLLVSGGNLANITCFLAARAARSGWDIRRDGASGGPRLCVYASSETHTWIQKAADLTGLGVDSIRWIATDSRQRIDLDALEARYQRDVDEGNRPFLVVGSAGTVSTGAVDPLPELAAFCRKRDLWFHIDGAYGAFAAAVPDAPEDLTGVALADSIAVDPHKWLYAPLEAGCALVRDPAALRNAFSYRPPYYSFEAEAVNYTDYGPQNSRGFRALKVWLAFRHAGAEGYRQMIADDMSLARYLYDLAAAEPEIEAFTHNLSITTFRYVPPELRDSLGSEQTEEYLNRLNQELQVGIERSGEAFVSHAVIGGKHVLRLCIVNFRSSTEDIEALPPLVVRLGREINTRMKSSKPGP